MNPAPMVCPECGETAILAMPTDLTPTQRQHPPYPRWRHLDGTQLCPMIGDHGYEPADAVAATTDITNRSTS